MKARAPLRHGPLLRKVSNRKPVSRGITGTAGSGSESILRELLFRGIAFLSLSVCQELRLCVLSTGTKVLELRDVVSLTPTTLPLKLHYGNMFRHSAFDKGGLLDKRYRDVLKPAIDEAGLKPYRVDGRSQNHCSD